MAETFGVSKISGLEKVLNKLNKQIKKIEGRSIQGMVESTIIVSDDMDKIPPKIPVDTGNLRGSWFLISLMISGMPVVIFGFSANYAFFVHEMVGATKTGEAINWGRPGSGPKFLESSLKRNKNTILKRIQNKATIK